MTRYGLQSPAWSSVSGKLRAGADFAARYVSQEPFLAFELKLPL
jgi:hypothetical protein